MTCKRLKLDTHDETSDFTSKKEHEDQNNEGQRHRKTSFVVLPPEMTLEINSHLFSHPKDQTSLLQTCRRFHDLCFPVRLNNLANLLRNEIVPKLQHMTFQSADRIWRFVKRIPAATLDAVLSIYASRYGTITINVLFGLLLATLDWVCHKNASQGIRVLGIWYPHRYGTLDLTTRALRHALLPNWRTTVKMLTSRLSKQQAAPIHWIYPGRLHKAETCSRELHDGVVLMHIGCRDMPTFELLVESGVVRSPASNYWILEALFRDRYGNWTLRDVGRNVRVDTDFSMVEYLLDVVGMDLNDESVKQQEEFWMLRRIRRNLSLYTEKTWMELGPLQELWRVYNRNGFIP
ncbi:hypothetical protein BJ508DRAFT_363105 [Ascobolus immersus RN42]|uniref:F-box domain-containing protein n=1 Tax=Ascobolus immersus RN42 TaxID=1160509 RepID=A0A3N4I0G7_ASCIM|nr:hypothetical protein BJ508DRAFT_363105 [Ascobolus immersus RN42]